MREHKDADFAHGAEFTALAKQALESNTYVLDGCELSKTDDWDIDLSSGNVAVSGTETAVSGQTVTISSEDTFTRRYDLITVDDTGTANVTEGTEDSTAPPLPSGEVLIGIVKVDKDASGVASEDIFDTRIVFALDHNLLSGIGPNDHIDNITDIPDRSHNDLNDIGPNDHIDDITDIPNRDHDELNGIDANNHHSKTTSGEIVHDDTQGGTASGAHHTKTTSYSDMTDTHNENHHARPSSRRLQVPSDNTRSTNDKNKSVTNTSSYEKKMESKLTGYYHDIRVEVSGNIDGGSGTIYLSLRVDGTEVDSTTESDTLSWDWTIDTVQIRDVGAKVQVYAYVSSGDEAGISSMDLNFDFEDETDVTHESV